MKKESMLKKMEIKTQIDPTHAAKLPYIQQQTRQEIAEILGQALTSTTIA